MVKLTDQSGFSYPAMLGFLLVAGILSQAALTSQAMRAKREIDHRVEAEGEAFVRALESYYAAGGEKPELPTDIAQLLEDRRDGIKRHLRRELVSPFEGDDWQFIRDGRGKIEGVFLDSDKRPVRTKSHDTSEITSYRDWSFRPMALIMK